MLFRDFDDLFTFNSPFYSFDRATKDMIPYAQTERDGKLFLVVNVLGVSKNDIKIEVKATDKKDVSFLVISGKTRKEVLDRDYRVNMGFYIYRPMKSLEWDVENGLLQMEIQFEEPVSPSVKIIKR